MRRTMATIAVALFVATVLFAAIVTLRKRTASESEPPLHPSTLIAIAGFPFEFPPHQRPAVGETFHN